VKKVLFVLPPTYNAHLPHFRSRFELLSEQVECHVLLNGDTSLDGEQFKNCTLYVEPWLIKYTIKSKLKRTLSMIKRGVQIARREKVDFVWAYDPLRLGFVATVIKLLSGCKLIIEINGHLKSASAKNIESKTSNFLRSILFNFTCYFSLFLADAVKLLNRLQFQEWIKILKFKPCFMFHDFVPISLFTPTNENGNYIFFAGYPFKTKGVDVLLEAFATIRNVFPDVKLAVMGYCREPELSFWRSKFDKINNAELCKPVPYDEMHSYLSKCLLFVLPSRSEAMGRVLIEAMACGKPLIGTKVGGIPNIIFDGYNGFLCNPEDAKDLSDKILKLLSCTAMRKCMGNNGKKLANTIFSEVKYVDSCLLMLSIINNNNKLYRQKGIIYSAYFNNDNDRL
jgi:glycosyltransferase involved in cell wall biosynthesis